MSGAVAARSVWADNPATSFTIGVTPAYYQDDYGAGTTTAAGFDLSP